MLDGLEVTLVGAVAPLLAESDTLHLSDAQIGMAATIYLAGAICGALVFGRMSDTYGRKRLLLRDAHALRRGHVALTQAASWSFASFAVFRAMTGAAIGVRGLGGQLGHRTSFCPLACGGTRISRSTASHAGWGTALGGSTHPPARQLFLRPVHPCLANCLLARCGARSRHHRAAQSFAREPALATPARPGDRGGGGDSGHRASRETHARSASSWPVRRPICRYKGP